MSLTEAKKIKTETNTEIETMVHRWGCSISEATLDSQYSYFTDPPIEGFIGYRHLPDYAVVFGDPICPINQCSKLANSFHTYCLENKIDIAYIVTTELFAKWAIENNCNILIEVGEELIFNPQNDPTDGPQNYKLRNYISHAQKKGLQVQEYLKQNLDLENAINRVGSTWLKERKGPQIYLSDLNFFENRIGKRWFYLEKNNKIIGMALLSRLELRKGWLLKFLITIPAAPRGSSEILMTKILDTLRHEGCQFLTYGMIPADSLGEIIGLNTLYTWLARAAFQCTKWIYNLNKRKVFWKKFQPKPEPVYVLFSKSSIGFKDLKTILNAFKSDTK